MMDEAILLKFFKAIKLKKDKPCKWGLGCGHAQPCCSRGSVYPPVEAKHILKLMRIVNEEYNILITNLYVGSTVITACYAPDVDLGADEAYFRKYGRGLTYEEALIDLCANTSDGLESKFRAVFEGEDNDDTSA